MNQGIHINRDDYFSLTDIAGYKNPGDPRFVIQNWMRRIDTIPYIGLWEQPDAPDFNRVEFDQFKNEAAHRGYRLKSLSCHQGIPKAEGGRAKAARLDREA